MFDFEPTEEQKALIETARRFARERIIPIAAECDRAQVQRIVIARQLLAR